jgi:ferrochelatase
MAADGVRHALAFVTSAFSSYSGCRQYRENISAAQAEVGSTAPQVDKLRVFFNHPGFINPMVERTRDAFAEIAEHRRRETPLVFTAHSIPQGMADGCLYEVQLREACQLVAEALGHEDWHLAYQSRSGPPSQPWLEPDVVDFIRDRHARQSLRDVVVAPIGFISDHLEVLYDLDTEAQAACDSLGIQLVRVATVGTHPRFIAMIRELVEERISGSPLRISLGTLGAKEDICPENCCVYSPRRPAAPSIGGGTGR